MKNPNILLSLSDSALSLILNNENKILTQKYLVWKINIAPKLKITIIYGGSKVDIPIQKGSVLILKFYNVKIMQNASRKPK